MADRRTGDRHASKGWFVRGVDEQLREEFARRVRDDDKTIGEVLTALIRGYLNDYPR